MPPLYCLLNHCSAAGPNKPAPDLTKHTANSPAVCSPRTPVGRMGQSLPGHLEMVDILTLVKSWHLPGSPRPLGEDRELGEGFDNNNPNRKTHLSETRDRLKQRGANIPTLRTVGRTQNRWAAPWLIPAWGWQGRWGGGYPRLCKIPCFCVFLVCVVYPSLSSPIDKIY